MYRVYETTRPNLAFYYYTSSHDRFYEGERPSFDKPGKGTGNPRNQPTRRIEQLSQMQGRLILLRPSERSIQSTYQMCLLISLLLLRELLAALIDHNH